MHTLNQFVSPLPKDYKSFREQAHTLFPKIYDTKLISSSSIYNEAIKSTALPEVYEKVRQKPFERTEMELKNVESGEEGALHAAGYDSFITGVCFAELLAYHGSLLRPPTKGFDLRIVSHWENKVYLHGHHDINCFDLNVEEQPEPDRSHVFYVTFPSQWKTSDLFQLFSPYGGVQVGWLSDSSALCALRDPEQAAEVRKNMIPSPSNCIYKVLTYKSYKAMKAQENGQKEEQSQPKATPSKRNGATPALKSPDESIPTQPAEPPKKRAKKEGDSTPNSEGPDSTIDNKASKANSSSGLFAEEPWPEDADASQ